jgi:hypothetical protein
MGQPMSGGNEGADDHEDLSDADEPTMNSPTAFEIVRIAFSNLLGDHWAFPFIGGGGDASQA